MAKKAEKARKDAMKDWERRMDALLSEWGPRAAAFRAAGGRGDEVSKPEAMVEAVRVALIATAQGHAVVDLPRMEKVVNELVRKAIADAGVKVEAGKEPVLSERDIEIAASGALAGGMVISILPDEAHRPPDPGVAIH